MENIGKQIGCPCCTGKTDEILEMDTRLYQGFGGWSILKDGEMFFGGDSNDDWDKIKQLHEIEKEAKSFPKSEWIASLYLPLREAKYKRSECGNWKLISTGNGFA